MSNIRDIKHAQKESLFFKILSEIFLNLTQEEPGLVGIQVSKVALSRDKGTVTILFYCEDEELFQAAFSTLILYKPSMRKALGEKISSRYIPQIRFSFDKKCKRQQSLEAALHQVSQELNGNESASLSTQDDTAADS